LRSLTRFITPFPHEAGICEFSGEPTEAAFLQSLTFCFIVSTSIICKFFSETQAAKEEDTTGC